MKTPLLSVVVLGLALFLSGCVSYVPTLPAGYSGPRAKVRDTALTHSGSKADFFCVDKVNGGDIEDSSTRTRVANQGRGFAMDPQFVDHELPAGQSVTLALRASTQYAADILALTNPVYQVKGEITFTPEADHIYAVKGVLGADYSAVWLEDTATQQVVDKKIEVHGSAKLGFWSK